MEAEVSSEVRECNVVELVHVEGYQAQNCFPTIFLGEVEVEKMKRTLKRICIREYVLDSNCKKKNYILYVIKANRSNTFVRKKEKLDLLNFF